MKEGGVSRRYSLERWIPGIRVLRHYEAAWLPKDLAAGITLGAVLVPVGLAYGSLAGLPMAGLYASIFPLILYALFGSSRQLIIGPDTSMAAIVAVSIVPLAQGDSGKLALLAAMLAVMVGIILILGSFLRLGFMADFLAKPVMVGFMHGLALVIFAGQLPKVLGFKVSGETALQQLVDVTRHLGQTHWPTLAIGVFCVVAILLLKHWLPRIPGPIVALVGSIFAVKFFHLESAGVDVVGLIPSGLPKFQVPILAIQDIHTLVPMAGAAALLAFSDTMVTARSFASRNHYLIDANQEMFALGLASIASGLTHGMPISVSGSRTAVAESAGSRSQLTSVLAAIVVACVMLFLTGLLYSLPMAALGGILIVSAYNLCEFGEFPRMWRFRGVGFFVALLTFAGVVGIGMMEGIGIGVLCSLVLILRTLAFPDDAVLAQVGEGAFHDRERYSEAKEIPGLVLYRFSGPLFFANAGQFRSRVEEVLEQAALPVRGFILDASAIINIDLMACETLDEIQAELQKRGISLVIANLRDYIRERLMLGWERSKSVPNLFASDLASAVRGFSPKEESR